MWIAIPACDEEARLRDCLAALATQRDALGAPLAPALLSVLVLANNCRDGTAALARAFAAAVPYRLDVEERRLPPELSHAGGARRCAMDLAAERLEAAGARDAYILTTDADSRPAPTWVAANLTAFAQGADGVAGYIDPDAAEFVALGAAFGRRGRAEDRYISAVTQIHALCDPRPHDPWPNHRTASGASLGVTLDAYRAIGGLPARPLGEDVALVHALECAGFRVRHSLGACVTTSCRFDGRAPGGAAETMRQRFEDCEAPCDGDLEPAIRVLRHALWKGRLRRLHDNGSLDAAFDWAPRIGLRTDIAKALAQAGCNKPFALLWDQILPQARRLRPGAPLRPSELAAQTVIAERIIARLRRLTAQAPRTERPADRQVHEPAAAREEAW